MYILCVYVYQSVFNVGVNTLYFHPVLLLQVLSEMGEMETGDLDVEIVRWIIFHSFFYVKSILGFILWPWCPLDPGNEWTITYQMCCIYLGSLILNLRYNDPKHLNVMTNRDDEILLISGSGSAPIDHKWFLCNTATHKNAFQCHHVNRCHKWGDEIQVIWPRPIDQKCDIVQILSSEFHLHWLRREKHEK